MYYSSWEGDPNSPIAINAYLMDKQTFEYSGTYPTDLNISEYCSRDKSILTNHRIVIASEKLDSIQNSDGTYSPMVRMRVNDDFLQEFASIRSFPDQKTFNEAFKGLLIETSFGSSTILNISDIALGVYYRFGYNKAGRDTVVHDFKAFYANFFNGITNGTIRHGSNAKYSDGSIQIWKNFGKSLHAYCPNEIPFSEITKPFADRFSLFLEKKGMMPNTVNKYVTCFRKLCNLAAEEGYNTNAVSLKVWKERTVKEVEKRAEIYLTDEEIDAMYSMKLEGMEEMVRDVFLLGYFSCQRYSDYSKLREENFITYDTGLGVISLTQKKTGNVVNVPIVDKRVNELCEKYHYDFPILTEQQMNVKIKVVAEKLSKDVPSLQEKFVTVLTAVERRAEDTYAKLLKKKKSGKKLTENERKWYYKQHKLAESHNGNPLWERNKHGEVIRPKYELVSSHTSRRSGTTNLYKMGVLSSKEMRSITGHQSEKVFEKYIRVGISEQAQIVADKLLAAKKAKNGKVEK